jgi:hypothetical protein
MPQLPRFVCRDVGDVKRGPKNHEVFCDISDVKSREQIKDVGIPDQKFGPIFLIQNPEIRRIFLTA